MGTVKKSSKMSAKDEKKAVDLGLLDEDDEFEEFPAEEWDAKQEDQTDVNVWEDNWDDDAVEDDFSVQLSTYSRKRPHSHSPPMRSPEPLAKKMCSRATPPASPSRGARSSSRSNNANNKNGINGHSNGSNGHSNSNPEPKAPEETQESPTSSRGRRSRGGSSTSSRDDSEPSSSARSTRSSARLR